MIKRVCDLCGVELTAEDQRSRIFRLDDVEVEVRLLWGKTKRDICLKCQVQVVTKGQIQD